MACQLERQLGDEIETDFSPNGEIPDGETTEALRLPFRIVNQLPDLKKLFLEHRGPLKIVSTVAVLGASIAAARRLTKGENPNDFLSEITTGEIVKAGRKEFNRWRDIFKARIKRLQRPKNKLS